MKSRWQFSMAYPCLFAVVAGTVQVAYAGTTAAPLKPDGWKAMTNFSLQLQQQNANMAWSYIKLTDGSRRYEVRSGDRWSIDSNAPVERSESYDPRQFEVGRTYQIAFQMMIEPGAVNTASWLVLTQTTSLPDPGEVKHSPPFALELTGDRLRVVTRYSSAKLSTPGTVHYINQYEDSAPLKRGQYYDIKIQMMFGPFGNGRLKLWRNNVLLVNYTGALGFNDIAGPYLKQGIYRSATNQKLALKFRYLKVGLTN